MEERARNFYAALFVLCVFKKEFVDYTLFIWTLNFDSDYFECGNVHSTLSQIKLFLKSIANNTHDLWNMSFTIEYLVFRTIILNMWWY